MGPTEIFEASGNSTATSKARTSERASATSKLRFGTESYANAVSGRRSVRATFARVSTLSLPRLVSWQLGVACLETAPACNWHARHLYFHHIYIYIYFMYTLHLCYPSSTCRRKRLPTHQHGPPVLLVRRRPTLKSHLLHLLVVQVAPPPRACLPPNSSLSSRGSFYHKDTSRQKTSLAF